MTFPNRFIAGVLMGTAVSAQAAIPPDELVMPCERHVQVEDITRLVVPMVPFRGVNLIFPFELNDSTTSYAISSNLVWDFKEANGSRMVPVYFSSFEGQWGELTDLTIAAENHIFSITLKADKDIRNHCTNIVFDFSEEQLKAIQEGEKKEHLARLDEEFEKRLKQLDDDAAEKALELVGALAKGSPSVSGIHEYNGLTLSNGDEIELYVEEIQGWGEFSVIKAEITNDSEVSPLYIRKVQVGLGGGDQRKQPISGHADMEAKIKEDAEGELTFTTTENVPETGGYMEIETDRGTVEVVW
ncbi:hypothetical protein Q672_10790 [Marinobacter sp. EVN1]|uniref:hypothetical protein n=1 Tax=Marinobacter sp. EVN1 TaxID=1397532 RepID=UPI0003B904A5|nr:hypothetical protein [Marinobacter sp. EVN1]ERS88335.1 hypothetical protein Q672_10790 [Marinobacter sp. EVN1]